jgi:hypothetical protein
MADAVTRAKRAPQILVICWGRMEVEGLAAGKDFRLYPGGGRPWDWAETGTRHSPGIQPADVEELLAHGADTVVLSQRMNERLPVHLATRRYLQQRSVRVHVAAKTGPDHYQPRPATAMPPDGHPAPSRPATPSYRTRPGHTPRSAAAPAPPPAPPPAAAGRSSPAAGQAQTAWWPAAHPARKRQPPPGPPQAAQPSATYHSARPTMASAAAGETHSNRPPGPPPLLSVCRYPVALIAGPPCRPSG